jgi:DNA-binding NarL/FixJ family response regulator
MLPARQRKLSVLVACTSPPMRSHLRALLIREPAFCFCGEADTGEATLDLFFRYRPEVVLVDVRLPDRNGFKVIESIKQAIPRCQAILLCHAADLCVEEVGRMVGANRVCHTGGELHPILVVLRELAVARGAVVSDQWPVPSNQWSAVSGPWSVASN